MRNCGGSSGMHVTDKRVPSAAVIRFFERHVVEMEKGFSPKHQIGEAGGAEERRIAKRP